MSDDVLKNLTKAVSSLTDIVSTLIEEAKVEHLSHLQKHDLQKRVWETNGLLAKAQAGKLDGPTLS
jgi:hypothetical protein